MPWVRVDDHFDEHPKMAAVGPVGWGVWLAGLAYSNRNLTDGFIPYAIAEGIGGSWRVREPVEDEEELENGLRTVRNRERVWSIDLGSGMHGEGMNTEWVVAQLVRVGLWEAVSGGYRIHDYGDYQPSKEAVLRDRKAAAGRQAALRGKSQPQSRPQSRRDTVPSTSYPVPKPVPVPNPVSVPESHARDSVPRERADVQALLDRGWHRVTAKQRRVLDELADRHDLAGIHWAADRIREAPRDVDLLRHVLDLDREYQSKRRGQIEANERAEKRERAA